MKFLKTNNSSFTLIELLVVLALVAILSVVVVITLNPAELIKQARDSNRLSDLSTINTALNLFNADVTAGFMGTSTIVYVSIPDNASSTCGSLGLPALPSGYSYNCVTTANLRNTNGTGWIPVNFQRISSNSPISQLPIDPRNTTSTGNYYIYMSGGSWSLSATAESQKYLTNAQSDSGFSANRFELGNDLSVSANTHGWIRVPGNSFFGTSDFWLMDHEAKCLDMSGNPFAGAAYGSYGAYNNSSTSTANSACIAANSKYVASVSGGYQIARISQIEAVSYCQNIGAHLVTNNEWQTVAWNAQNVVTNWRDGVIGSTEASGGGIYRGHSNGSAAVNGTSTLTGVNKRTHVLSNGQVIWDLAGNLMEWLNDLIPLGSQPQPRGYLTFSGVSNWGTVLTRETGGPVSSAWDGTYGVGILYTYYAVGNSTPYGMKRGGYWNLGAMSGIEALFLNHTPDYIDFYTGFRCAK